MQGDATGPAQLEKSRSDELRGNSLDEMEVVIRLDREDWQAHVCSTWPEWSRKLERLYASPK
jgi:hypothetical protein